MTAPAVVIAIAAVAAGCGARVDVDPGDDTADDDGDDDDAPPGADARTADAVPPVDAAPCTGGNAQAEDGATCYEAFLALPIPWDQAQAVCAGRGGALAKIDDAAENQIVTILAGDIRVWIGGTDAVTEGTFVWTDGTLLAAGYTNWRDGEPNNANGNFEEDCTVLEGQNDGTWDDRPCAPDPDAGVAGEYFYVCER